MTKDCIPIGYIVTLPLQLPIQREDEEEEKMSQRGGTEGVENIPTDEPMKINAETAASREDELALEEATNGRHVDVVDGGIPCSNGKAILGGHVEESTVALEATNHRATEGESRRSIRARKDNSLYKGFVMG